MGFSAFCAISFVAAAAIAAFGGVLLALPTPPFEIITRDPVRVPTEMGIAEPRATLAALANEVAVLAQTPPPQSPPTSTPVAPSTSVIPLPISHPMADYTIDGLRARAYSGGTIHVRSILTTTHVFTRYYIDYPSDDLTITGIMQVPQGEGPFPVVILNHGYVPRRSYWPGADTWQAAEYLNGQGYLTIASDFRSWGESDSGNSFFSTGQVIDVLNLISSLPSLADADAERVGMWGHSMGGGVATKAITVDPRIKAAVLYAPVSADDEEVLARWGVGCRPGGQYQLADECAGAEILTADVDESLFLAYADAMSNPGFLHQISPINYFDFVVAPVQIHIGTADTTTPPEWSAAIRDALQESGKEVEYFTYLEQGHAFQGEHWRLFMKRVTEFFDRYLKDDR